MPESTSGTPAFSEDNPYLPSPAASHDPNPYAAPHTGLERPAAPVEGTPRGNSLSEQPLRIDSTTIYRDTWAIFKNNLGQEVLFSLAFVGITFGASMVMQIVIGAMSQVGTVAAIAANVIMQILNLFVGGYTSTVAVRFTCNLTRGSASPLNDAFSSLDYVLRLVLFNLAFMLCYVPIGILIVLPFGVADAMGREPFTPISIGIAVAIGSLGIILMVWLVWMRVLLTAFFIVDRDMGMIDAIKASARYMEGNKASSFMMLLVVGLVGGLFCLCTCYLGILLVMPYAWILMGLIYLTATGQPYALPHTENR